MSEALQKLGFAGAEETAVGATIVKTRIRAAAQRRSSGISSSPPAATRSICLIQKYFPAELPYLADVLSPMQAHCADIKRRYPGAKTVFIGPCVAKKDEAEHYGGLVDAVLTFEELTAWMAAANVTARTARPDRREDSRARFFPTTGGMLKTMAQDAPGYTYMAVDGVENCIAALRDIEERTHPPLLYRDVRLRRQLRRRPRHGEIPPRAHPRLCRCGGIRRHARFRGRAAGYPRAEKSV